MVERKAEVEMILEMTDPELVFVTLDTCHASVGGIDPAKFARRTTRESRIFTSRTRCRSGTPEKDGGVRRRARKRRQPWRKTRPATVAGRDSISGSEPAACDFPAVIQVLRDRHYDGWISLDFNYVDMPPGVTIEQDMAEHRKYLVETLHASLTPMK